MRRFLILVIGMVFLAGCNRGDVATPVPVLFPTPVPLPPRTTFVPTPTPPPGATATPFAQAPTRTPTSPVSVSPSLYLPGAYVNTSATTIRETPGGRVVSRASAGTRLGVLGRTPDGAWLHVQYAPAQSGWVSAATVTLFTAQTRIPILTPETISAPARSTSSPPAAGLVPGHIVFQTSNGGDIYIIGGDGSGLRRLTYGFEPALSPDGQWVAFTRWDEPRGLWLIGSDGSAPRLLFGANQARSPTWTPDQSAIVFSFTSSTRTCRQAPQGCLTDDELRQNFGGQDCLATPFGRFCVSDFPVVEQQVTGIKRVQLSDASSRDLPASGGARSPWSHPAADRILYLDNQGYAVTQNSSDAPPRSLVTLPGQLGPAIFSADGQFLLGSRRSGDHWDIWRWASDGSGATALTAPPALRSAPVHSVSPTLSPDGRTLLFLTDRRGRWEFWTMNSDGSAPRPFAEQALAGIPLNYQFANDRGAHWGQ